MEAENNNQNGFISNPKFRIDGTEVLRPDDKGSAEIYSRLGYKLHEAIADLVDNSIDAKARHVLIRFIRTDDLIRRVMIIDDGEGMDDEVISEAMRIGSSQGKSLSSLGKYGLGLKSASLNQANSVSVLSLSNEVGYGRKWTKENIEQGWICEKLEREGVEEFLNSSFGPIRLKDSGTIVLWEDLQHLKTNASTIEGTINQTIKSLKNELGLRFHRFIAGGRLDIYIDVQANGKSENQVIYRVIPLDPFSYPVTGKEGYPKTFEIELQPFGKLHAETHIWPPKSNDLGYKLGGGKTSSRQGIYFYRNDRLIQAGGWNGCRDDDSEPHLSLARVIIDLPPEFDATFQLNVTKSGVEPPPEFAVKLMAAVKQDGSSFRTFISDADAAYRMQQKKDGGTFKFTPGSGVSREVRDASKRILWMKGSNSLTPVDFKWKKLDPDLFFEVEHETHTIFLNSIYRSKVLAGEAASVNDAPLIKTLLMFLLHEQIDRKNVTDKYRDWLQRVNHALTTICNKEL